MVNTAVAMQRTKGPTALKIVEPEQLFGQIQQTFDTIARRAFEIFDGSGRSPGRHLEHWFRAESELLHPIHIDVAENDEQLIIRAEMPGFNANELQVSLDARRLTITGKREKQEDNKKRRKPLYREYCSDQLLRVIDLPTEVDRENVTATLKDGILELVLQKAAPAKNIPVEAKTA
jgi:HSP20 family protein